MKQWGFYFDQTRCIGCKTCTVACMSWNEDKRGDVLLFPEESIFTNTAYELPKGYETTLDGSRNLEEMRKYHMKEELIRISETEYGEGMPHVNVLYLALSCGHCEFPACVAACPAKRIEKDKEFGAVITNDQPCTACVRCQKACPFHAPQFYDDPGKFTKKTHGSMVKCDLCIERLRLGLKPACVAACRVRALVALPLEELKARYPDAVCETLDLPSDISPLFHQPTRPNWLFRPKKL